jgi:hypothetical protein
MRYLIKKYAVNLVILVLMGNLVAFFMDPGFVGIGSAQQFFLAIVLGLCCC